MLSSEKKKTQTSKAVTMKRQQLYPGFKVKYYNILVDTAVKAGSVSLIHVKTNENPLHTSVKHKLTQQ